MSRGRERWGTEENKIPAVLKLPTCALGVLSTEQLEAYALQYRILELTTKLRFNDVVPPERERSPSPPPVYDPNGKRINTRDVRYRSRLEQERHTLIEAAGQTIPGFVPPPDYRRPAKTKEKIYIPANDYPEVNFVGLIIGPRGKTLKEMEQKSGARIAIRGKGSLKEGKGRTDIPGLQNQDEDLHCVITADSEEKIQKAADLVNHIIETAASTPETQNELKQGQLKELAVLNGTWSGDTIECSNCGEIGHKRYDCPARKNYTSTVICFNCGGKGHFGRDCTERGNNRGRRNQPADSEYEQLMADIGMGGSNAPISGSNGVPLAIENRQGKHGDSVPWKQRNQHDQKQWRDHDGHRQNDNGYRQNDNSYRQSDNGYNSKNYQDNSQQFSAPGQFPVPGLPGLPGLPTLPPQSRPPGTLPIHSAPPGLAAAPPAPPPPGAPPPPTAAPPPPTAAAPPPPPPTGAPPPPPSK